MRKVLKLRLDKGLTQFQVAVATGVNPASLSRLETGTRKGMAYEGLKKLADFYQVPIEELLQPEEEGAVA